MLRSGPLSKTSLLAPRTLERLNVPTIKLRNDHSEDSLASERSGIHEIWNRWYICAGLVADLQGAYSEALLRIPHAWSDFSCDEKAIDRPNALSLAPRRARPHSMQPFGQTSDRLAQILTTSAAS